MTNQYGMIKFELRSGHVLFKSLFYLLLLAKAWIFICANLVWFNTAPATIFLLAPLFRSSITARRRTD